ncbi:M16 family metallopeptidase [Pseudomonas farsensis]|uniref:M16 family metallopeptidase n=1 Tax=Pseudomonas farsensis TaxID=2745492 RepID=UPI001CED48E5|nr:pitrilysin family protein [Pseudomonas farsensis]
MPNPPSTLQHFTLANGLRVYLREDRRAPLVSIQLWYHVGASYEPAGQSGLSHALEHLMFEGSSKLAPGEYTSLMILIGGEPNAFTTVDATVYPLTVPSHRVEIPLEAMADAMASASFEEAPFTRERDIVLSERRKNVDNNPLASAIEAHEALAHGSSPYASPVIGHRADLEQLTSATTRSWKQTWYHPNNATLAVAGSIGLEQLQAMVERHFADIAQAELPAAAQPRQDAVLAKRTQTVSKPGLRDGVLMSFNVPSRATASSTEQALALSLLPDLLCDGYGARLRRLLINDETILLNMSCKYASLSRGDTLFSIYAYTNPSKGSQQEAAERLFAELGKLAETGPTQAELERARARLLARQVFGRDNIANQAAAIGEFAVGGLDPLLMDNDAQGLKAVTLEHVKEAAAQFLREDLQTITFLQTEESRDD